MTLFCGIKRLVKCLSDVSIKVRRIYIYNEACIVCTERNLLMTAVFADSATKIAEMGKVKRGKA